VVRPVLLDFTTRRRFEKGRGGRAVHFGFTTRRKSRKGAFRTFEGEKEEALNAPKKSGFDGEGGG
jgi:hypothetical protein